VLADASNLVDVLSISALGGPRICSTTRAFVRTRWRWTGHRQERAAARIDGRWGAAICNARTPAARGEAVV